MPTVLRYDPSIAGIAEGYLQSSQEIAGAEQDRFDRRLAEEQRQFDQGLDYNAQVQALEDRLRRGQLAQNAYQSDQQFAIQQAGLGLDAQRQDIYAQQVQNQAQADAEQQARMRFGEFAGLAKQREEQQFEQAMSAQQAIFDARTKGVIDDDQFQEGIGQWEQTYGMPWAFPQQMAQEQRQAQQQQQIAALSQGFVDPISGSQLATPEQIQTWLDMGVEPKEIMNLQVKMTAEARNRAKFEADKEAGGVELQRTLADIEADNQLAQQKFEEQRRMGEIAIYNAQAKANADMVAARAKAKAAWAIKAATPGADGEKPALGPFDDSAFELPFPNLKPPANGGGGESLPMISDPRAARSLPSGTRFRTPDGRVMRVP